MMRPLAPTAQTSFGPKPQTSMRLRGPPVGDAVQVAPFQCMTTLSLTAHMSPGPLPQTEWKVTVGTPASTTDQIAPFQC